MVASKYLAAQNIFFFRLGEKYAIKDLISIEVLRNG